MQGMPEQLVNAGLDFYAGRITEEVFHKRVAAREKYALKIKTTKPNGDEVYYNPLNYGKYTTLIADGVKRPKDAPKALTKLFAKDLPEPEFRSGLLTGQKTITYPRERRAELRVQGPRWSTPEWYALYHRGRNTIEGINDKIKGGRYASIGDQTTRMVRGYTANSLFVAFAAVSVNVGLITRFVQRLVLDFDSKGNPSPTPPRPNRKDTTEFLEEVRWSNAPPIAA